MRKEERMKGKCEGTKEKLGSEIKRENVSSFAFKR